MPTIKELLNASQSINNKLSQSRQVTLVPGTTNVVEPVKSSELVSVFRMTDGARGERASKAGVSKEEAEIFIAARPENQYEIVSE